MIFSSIFAIVVGIGMIAQWTMSYKARNIPELQTEPIRIYFHISAEMLTAVCLIISGIGMLVQKNWARLLFLISSGMLFYTSIVSPGYFAQKGQWIWLILFGIIIILGLVSVVLVVS